jgi:hypothetical protein
VRVAAGSARNGTVSGVWWSVLAVGTVLLTLSSVASVGRHFTGRRIPRLGFVPPRATRPSRWLLAGLCAGLFLMAFAAGRLSETAGSYLAYFGGAVAVSVLVQAAAAVPHNHRLRAARPRQLS